MKQLGYLVVLMLLSSSAYAGNSFSFVVGGNRIRIEAPRHCGSPSCVSVSIPGVYGLRRGRDRKDDTGDVPEVASAKPLPPATVQAPPPPVVTPPSQPSITIVASVPTPPATVAASTTQPVAPPPPAVVDPPPKVPEVAVPAAPPVPAPVETPTGSVRPVPPPQISRVSHEVGDQPADTPVGDWETAGNKGSVRIQQCGTALCGYVLDKDSNSNGETVLINMKPKAGSAWSGNIMSRDSGDTYYATMAMKGANSLRVEACALGRFFCSGQIWSRIDAKPAKLVSTRQMLSTPRS